ncbi:EDD domain protein, DegV family [Caloranaerobacter azorensis DSM 13643]|uniref:EDD domain protein, DegV family n=1 Tax=Caloranaerobacter azorensis DSM 13643 TaxID=1121264 RepID=A0A1M5SDC0_9FIRM|nr:DegV family protein [Caloranaerobacter azorensis]SHH36592.1 EDD domain protein, DegV family [Caloranaerobacter azorensis DSM 13643]
MEKIKIITDSVSDVPLQYIDEYDIEVVPLTINFESESYKDKVDITVDEFYKKMDENAKLPTTSQITPMEFLNIYEKFKDDYDYLIVITLSSKISGTYQSAITAMQLAEMEDKVTVIDSKGITLGQGLIVLEAAKMAKDGKSKDEIVERLNELIDKLEYIIVIDSLENLKKLGRISAAKAFLGEKLKIKPVITMRDGYIVQMDKIRGRKKAIKWIIEKIKSDNVNLENKTIGINHARNEEISLELVNAIRENFNVGEIIFSEVGCTVAIFAGTGAFAIYYERE